MYLIKCMLTAITIIAGFIGAAMVIHAAPVASMLGLFFLVVTVAVVASGVYSD